MYYHVNQSWSFVNHVQKPEKVISQKPDINNSKLRYTLQQTRISKRISIQELSKHVNIDSELLTSFERGEDVIPKEKLLNIIKFMDIDISI